MNENRLCISTQRLAFSSKNLIAVWFRVDRSSAFFPVTALTSAVPHVSVAAGDVRVEAQTFMFGPSRTPQRGFSIEQISIVPELIVQLYVRVLK